ncbi:hypothetical protein ABTY96_39295 [Streptomyces sp. NPDC096057]|uniref:hypothetical protein n=1 Tax=Streptomyces sp. NPDC096057 TaxID=3155543 RepID=UPI0033279EEE
MERKFRCNRNTARSNTESGFFFATGTSRPARNLAVGTPAFTSTDATTAHGPRRADPGPRGGTGPSASGHVR